ncbi:MAG: ribonuclease D [Gammaproteobacteria bacterium]|nr:ribonuclease D [Gammaproteobacteria bacterium]
MQERYIETPGQLEQLCDSLRESRWLALDTEFIREKTYYPQLCLLQVCNGETAACVDPLRLDSLDPLIEVVMQPSIVKIFHAGRQDLEIFNALWQRLPAPLFDTQLAATLLGLGEQIGYAALVQKLLGVDLDKGHTRTDWSRRPLQDGQLRYALDDVIYLGEIYLEFAARLRELGRTEWLQEEFALLTNPDTYRIDPAAAWQKIKGRQRLRGAQLAVLQALAAWRENLAVASDRPKRWIAKDEILVDLARRMPKTLADLGHIRGLEQGLQKRHGEELLGLITQSRALPRTSWPQDKQPPLRLTPNQEALADLLMCCLRLLAEQNQVSPAMLASRSMLEQLVAGERDIELLHGWRRMLAGDSLLEVLAGRRAPNLVEGRLALLAVADDHSAG